MQTLHFDRQPLGVHNVPDRTDAYELSGDVTLSAPSHKIFRRGFPEEFSILLTYKSFSNNDGLLFSVTDFSEVLTVGFRVGQTASFIYGHQSKTIALPYLLDNQWHSVGISIRSGLVAFRFDCAWELRRELPLAAVDISRDSMIAIGNSFLPEEGQLGFQVRRLSQSPCTAHIICLRQTSFTDAYLAACRELALDYNTLLKLLYVFEHKS